MMGLVSFHTTQTHYLECTDFIWLFHIVQTLNIALVLTHYHIEYYNPALGKKRGIYNCILHLVHQVWRL